MYRILTEDVNREAILSILDAVIDGYTMFPVMGAWKGTRENSLAIDIVGEKTGTVHNIAELIKLANKQDSVLVIEMNANPVFV